MPIYATPRGLLLFAHVPKCGGSSIEDVLSARFGPEASAFLDRSHFGTPTRWSRSSPQHIEASALIRLVPRAMLALNVAVVRHPATRIRSVYMHQRDVEGRIEPDEDFDVWLDALPARRQDDPWYLDNHARPACEMVPGNCRTFKLEQGGVEATLAWIDARTGGVGMPPVRSRHDAAERLHAAGRTAGPMTDLTPARLRRIASLYSRDYERFGYGIEPPARAS